LIVLIVAAAGGRALAQDANAAPADANANALPSPGKVLNLIEKASGPTRGEGGGDWSAPVKLAVVFALLALLPSLLVMMTSFTRIVIVLAFLRRALTTQNIPPTIALIGLALFLTLFTMSPTLAQINREAVGPYLEDQIAFPEACSRGNAALKQFMAGQVRAADLKLFLELSGAPAPSSAGEVPAHVMIPSFAVSEFRKAFEMGCLIFVPFLLVDLVTSGILLSAGMMMLPPALISLPFKIILFVLVDGWHLVARTLVTSFH
jgi:flagellar biosynthetic protein FliP